MVWSRKDEAEQLDTQLVSLDRSLFGQVLANGLLGSDVKKSVVVPSIASGTLAMITITYITKCWAETPRMAIFKDCRMSFYTCISCDRRIWLLARAQPCIHFSIAVFWILWAPTLVADG
ncbi:hypothetical protein CK203_004727 [Vitis vinifera]|uniref:Uncharacterized protein n=1 Tax=Vitis vinifera TaxID=29760 RepID=A0A438KFN0_VITVI|nr:hypothetical protein CK203_004727 [Vitis vinifera]